MVKCLVGGCPTQGTMKLYDQMREHNCKPLQMACPLKCNKVLTAETKNIHLTECPNSIIKCAKCSVDIVREFKYRHKIVCLEVLILQLDVFQLRIISLLHLLIFFLKTEYILHEELRHCLDAIMLTFITAQRLHQAFFAGNFFVCTLVFVLLLIRAEDLLITLTTRD